MTNARAAAPPEMNSITGKLVLSLVRGRDYAHAGEEEAIERVLGPLAGSVPQRFLDVGCGLGGTARYVSDRSGGQVTGIDLDPDNIAAAGERHPDLTFHCCDAAALADVVRGPFDVVYLLNAFFLFSDQASALRAMRSVAGPSATLAIFDYVDLGGYARRETHRETPGLRHPLALEAMEPMLTACGWRLERIVPMHAEYRRWYEELVARIGNLREPVVAKSSPAFYDYVLTTYSEMLEDIRAGRLGGATVYARADAP